MLQLGAFKRFQCHCSERKEEKNSEGKIAREKGREGGRKGGCAREPDPAAGRRSPATAGTQPPAPTEASVGPATSLGAQAATFPGPAASLRVPRRPRCPHPVLSHSWSRRRGPAPTSARRRPAASRAQSSGRVFQICKRGSGAEVSVGRAGPGRAGAGGAAAAAAAQLPARQPLSPCCRQQAAPAGQE